MSKVITLVVSEDEKTIEVTNSNGEKIQVQGITLFGGDAQLGCALAIGYGCAADAAWATAFHRNDPRLCRYFAHLLAHMDPAIFNRQINAEEILQMWEEEDEEEITYN